MRGCVSHCTKSQKQSDNDDVEFQSRIRPDDFGRLMTAVAVAAAVAVAVTVDRFGATLDINIGSGSRSRVSVDT